MAGYFTIGEFADRAGVTARTIRYYDQIGLLQPSAYSESGRRLYSELDYTRLQQILTLKLIGLSLEDIGQLLTTDTAQVQHLLQRQKRVLEEKARQLMRVIQTIEQAQRSIEATHTLDLEAFIHIIKAVNMNQQADWLSQFMTEAQQEKLVEASSGQTLAQQKASGEAWKILFEDVQNSLHKDVHHPDVQALVIRWDALVQQASPDGADFADPLNSAYAHLGTLPELDSAPPAVREWVQSLQAAASFIQQARQANQDNHEA